MSENYNKKVLNFKPQLKDSRDYIYENEEIELKSEYFLTDIPMKNCPILDQGEIGSCLANAIYALMYIISKGKINSSRLYNYICYRASENESLTEDTGGTIRGGMKAIKNYGLCDEKLWPYKDIINNYKKLPPKSCFKNGYNIKNFVYKFIPQNETSIKNSLVSGKPIILGILIYESFYNENANKYGIISIPDFKKESILGGHAVLLVGYDNKTRVFKFQNSWGINWGDKGYGYFPYDYILNKDLSFDLCTVSFT
jgi:C1A family cysteine protease